jgi:hypothetical protein
MPYSFAGPDPLAKRSRLFYHMTGIVHLIKVGEKACAYIVPTGKKANQGVPAGRKKH